MLAVFVLHDGIFGSFHNKATINASELLVYYDKTWMKSFDMLKKGLLSSHPWPNMNVQCTIMKEKLNIFIIPDNNFMICLFDFEKFSIESGFPIVLTHTVYLTKWILSFNSVHELCKV